MSLKRALIISSLMILTFIYIRYLYRAEEVIPNRPLSTFPEKIGEWAGYKEKFDPSIYEVLGVDDSFLATYRTEDGRQVQLYIGFYQSQRQGDLIHSPKNCMPGGGWNIMRTSREELDLRGSNTSKIRVIRLLIQNKNQRQIVLYWFQSRGRFISSEYMQKLYLVWDAIFKNRTDGSFIRLIAPVQKNEAETTAYLSQFAEEVVPILQKYLPGA